MISPPKILTAVPVAICLLMTFSVQGKKITKMKNAKVVEIVDGDTIIVRQAQYRGFYYRDKYMIDLAGVRALPIGTKIGKDAYTFLKRKLYNETVDLYLITNMNGWIVKKTGYGDMSEELIERGLAYRVTDDGLYAKTQESAEKRNRGLWKDPDTAALARQYALEMDPLSQAEYDDHALPDYFHDIQAPVQEENYVEKREEYERGHAYDLVITGLDYFYERATVPRSLYVYSARTRRPTTLFFVIAGMDYREVEELRPREYLTVSCVYVKNIRVYSWYKTYTIPLFKYVGSSPTLGVGGELMYYK